MKDMIKATATVIANDSAKEAAKSVLEATEGLTAPQAAVACTAVVTVGGAAYLLAVSATDLIKNGYVRYDRHNGISIGRNSTSKDNAA